MPLCSVCKANMNNRHKMIVRVPIAIWDCTRAPYDNWHAHRIASDRDYNESVAPTAADRARFSQTSSTTSSRKSFASTPLRQLDLECCHLLNINPNLSLTPDIINK